MTLGAKNGFSGGEVTFLRVKSTKNGGNFANNMKAACNQVGMKPICAHKNYCATDAAALYIGQDLHFQYRSMMDAARTPSGFDVNAYNAWIQTDDCAYVPTAKGPGGQMLCATSGAHIWAHDSTSKTYMCGKVASRRSTPALPPMLLASSRRSGGYTKMIDGESDVLVMKLSKNEFCYGSSRWTDGSAYNTQFMNDDTFPDVTQYDAKSDLFHTMSGIRPSDTTSIAVL